MKTPFLLATLVLAALASGCQCGRNMLVDVATIDPGQVSDAGTGVLRFCGDNLVSGSEECDPGLEGSATSECNSDCTLNRSCPPGQAWSEGKGCVLVPLDAGVGAEIVGTLSEYTGILPASSVLHPWLPIKNAVVRLQLKDSTTDVGVVITPADGSFRFAVTPNVAYQVRYELTDEYETERGYARSILPVPAGGTGNASYQFLRRGLHFTVQDRKVGGVIAGVQVFIVDEAMTVLAPPQLTDAEGYVYFARTARPGTMVFTKTGYARETLGNASVNTTHTVVGGMSLQKEE